MQPFVDHYETLQISPNADLDTIHRVYRILGRAKGAHGTLRFTPAMQWMRTFPRFSLQSLKNSKQLLSLTWFVLFLFPW